MASGGKITTLYGGVPVIVDGQVIGAVGVGGGSGEQDARGRPRGHPGFTDQLDEPAAARCIEQGPDVQRRARRGEPTCPVRPAQTPCVPPRAPEPSFTD